MENRLGNTLFHYLIATGNKTWADHLEAKVRVHKALGKIAETFSKTVPLDDGKL
jgi:hypothetical protein